MASTVIPHFTKGGDLITSGTLSAGTIYTATRPCKIIINGSAMSSGYPQPMYCKINGSASSSNKSFTNSGGSFEVNDNAIIYKISTIFKSKDYQSIVSVELDAGEYLSVASQGNFTGNYYVYSI